MKPVEIIRERVEHRHWQLFEARLKRQTSETSKENYTTANNYRIIERFQPEDRSQQPIEPNRRWETFCQQLTNRSNETNRLMSIFHNVWKTNWNNKQIETETTKRRMSDPGRKDSTIFKVFQTNEHDRQVISNILHRTTP